MLTSELTGLSYEGQYVFLPAYFLKVPWTCVALAAAVYLWIVHKEIRWKILMPLAVMMIAVATPVAYQYSFRRYWRMFWIFPRGILTAMAAIDLFRRFKNQWIRLAALAAAGLTIFLTGANWFDHGTVKPAYTAYKINEGLPELCDRMLEETSEPRAIFTDSWGPLMVRQYSSDIELLWGRNAFGTAFILPLREEAREVYNTWNTEPKNWEYLFSYAAENGYNYIGTQNTNKTLKKAAKKNGYEIIEKAGKYILYGKKSRVIDIRE